MAGMTVINGGRKDPATPLKDTAEDNAPVTRPSAAQLRYLQLGVKQPGGKLPLFDDKGQEIKPATIRSCIEKGWAEPWFENPIQPTGWSAA